MIGFTLFSVDEQPILIEIKKHLTRWESHLQDIEDIIERLVMFHFGGNGGTHEGYQSSTGITECIRKLGILDGEPVSIRSLGNEEKFVQVALGGIRLLNRKTPDIRRRLSGNPSTISSLEA